MEKTNEALKSRTRFFPIVCFERSPWTTIPAHQIRALRKTHQIVAQSHVSSKYITKDCIIRRCAISTNAASIYIHASSCFSAVRHFFSLNPFIRHAAKSVAAVSAHNLPFDRVDKLREHPPHTRMISTMGIHAANSGEKYVRWLQPFLKKTCVSHSCIPNQTPLRRNPRNPAST